MVTHGMEAGKDRLPSSLQGMLEVLYGDNPQAPILAVIEDIEDRQSETLDVTLTSIASILASIDTTSTAGDWIAKHATLARVCAGCFQEQGHNPPEDTTYQPCEFHLFHLAVEKRLLFVEQRVRVLDVNCPQIATWEKYLERSLLPSIVLDERMRLLRLTDHAMLVVLDHLADLEAERGML